MSKELDDLRRRLAGFDPPDPRNEEINRLRDLLARIDDALDEIAGDEFYARYPDLHGAIKFELGEGKYDDGRS